MKLRILFCCFFSIVLSQPVLAKEVIFSDIIVDVVSSLDRQLKRKFGSSIRYVPLIVTTPVNLNNFNQTNALARQIGQEVITQLVQKQYKVEEIRHAKEITSFVDVGEFILSRGSVIDKTYDIGFVVAGTYTATGTGIRFTAEVINVADSSIAAMESITLPFTKEIEILLTQNNNTKETPSIIQEHIPQTNTASVFTVPNDIY